MFVSLRRSLAALLSAGLVLAACGKPETPESASSAGAQSGETALAEGEVVDPTKRVRLLREVGPTGELPTAFTVRLTEAAFATEAVGKAAPEGTVLTFSPAVEGTLTVTSERELTFAPTVGFAPDTAYTATLEAVSNGSERHEAPVVAGDNPWTRSFTTPAFGLSRLSLVQRNFKRKQLLVDVVFTGPVAFEEVQTRLAVSFEDARIRPVSLVPGPRDSIVRMTLQGGSLDEGTLQVEVAAGVPLATSPERTAPEGSATLDVAAGQPIEIEALLVKEGVSGHYLEVVCNDPAAGGERWYWDRDTHDGWWLSSRCMALPESVSSSVHISPAVAFTVSEAPGGFRLFGDFGQGDYDVQIDAGLQTLDGGVLTEVWEGTARVPERTPTLALAAKGRYLPRSAWRNLPLRHLNVEAATLTVRHIPEENLVFWLGGDEPAASRTSNIVFERELSLGGAVDQEQTTWVDVGSLLPSVGKGVYELAVRENDGAARDAARLLLTDLQLLAKRSTPTPGMPYASELQVWTVDTHSTDPVSGTEVTLVRPSGQAVARCRTDSQGACTLTLPEPGVDETPPVALLARKGDDLTYLKFADLLLQSDSDTTGKPWFAAAPEDGEAGASYVASAWTDRGVYRPGETAHVAALVRGEAFTAPTGGLPVVVTLVDPRGKEVRRKSVSTDGAGVLTHDFRFADYASTGRYRVTLKVAERVVGETAFNVEEFVPERMAAEASAAEGGHRTTDAVNVDVQARWLFGGSAQGSPVEVDCRVEPAPFRPAKNASYHYGFADTGERNLRPLTLGSVEGVLGEGGLATVTCPSAGTGAASLGPARLIADVAVFEGDSGRTTRAVATTPLHPAEVYLGTRSNLDTLKRGETATIDGVVVDWEGTLVSNGGPTSVDVELFRLEEEYGWWWDDEDESSSYRRLLRRVSEGQQTVPVSAGRFTLAHTAVRDAAGWVVVFSHGDAMTEQYIAGKGRRYWWGPDDSTVDQTPRPRRPTALALDTPAVAKVGEDMSVSFTAPYPGRALVSVETNRVTQWEWIEVDAGAVTWTTRIKEFSPNVYVSAFLIKDPHLESPDAYLPDRSYGVASVKVEPTAYVHSVALDVPTEVRPYSSFDVGIAVTDARGKPVTGAVTATVAVVDEGVLSLTNFETPDPTKQIFARRRLGVDSFETVGWSVLMEPEGPSSATGGDAEGAGSRVQMVKPVALWSGPVQVENGKATVPFEVPGYRGQLRVMAVAASADRIGHAEAEVVVRDPIVVQTTLPRFLAEGDLAQIPVFLSNMSGSAQDVTVRLEVEDLTSTTGVEAVSLAPVAELVGAEKGYLSLEDGASGTVVFQVKANRAPAAARFRVVAEAGSLRSKEELELPVQPRLPEARRTQRMALTSTVDLDAQLDGKGWLEGADRTTFWVTTNPYADTLTHLRYLIRYPYGCIEQTSSSTRPLLYVSNLVDFIDPSLLADSSVDDMVKHGIDRVLSMQTPSGGFGYWPGSSRPSEWGTAYGTHMLLDARKAGHEVPEAALTDALDWLQRRVEQTSDAGSTEAYAAYVLALGGKDMSAKAEAVLEHLSKVDLSQSRYRYAGKGWKAEAEYLAMAAMHLSGDHRHEATLKALDTSAVDRTRSNGWSFYSDRRRRALMLSVYTDVFGVPSTDVGGQKAADLVAESLRGRSGTYTTQEMAWGITALGKRVAALETKLPDSTVTLAGKTLAPTREGKGGNRAWAVTGATGVEDLSLSLKGDTQAWLVTTTEGVRATDDLPTGGQGLSVSREYLTAAGQPLDVSRHTLGDTVYVRVELTNKTGRTQQNLALVDRLPAGWEIENPRLGRGSLPDWVDRDELWAVEHMNLRDDRLEVFGELRSGWTRTVVYEVRAVTAGSFTVPDVRAEAMYDPELWAREKGQALDIQGPWDRFLL